MDDKDVRILELLKENARARFVDIARDIDLTEGAVRHRVKALVDTGIIKRFTIESTLSTFEVFVLVKTDTGKSEKAFKKMKLISDDIFELSGSYDFALHVEAYTAEEINAIVDRIRNIPGVIETNTMTRLA